MTFLILSRLQDNRSSHSPGDSERTGLKRERARTAPRRFPLIFSLFLMLFAALAAAGCTSGSYPVDVFYEQHYQQSYKSHEPPRLSGVAGAVAFYPSPPNTTDDSAAHLFEVNCQMCHGSDGKDSGPVLQRLTMSQPEGGYGYEYSLLDPETLEPRPPNLTVLEPNVIAGYLKSATRPFGPTSIMPPFGKLLSEDEREAIVQYVGSLPK